jgi:hypothetical protein
MENGVGRGVERESEWMPLRALCEETAKGATPSVSFTACGVMEGPPGRPKGAPPA